MHKKGILILGLVTVLIGGILWVQDVANRQSISSAPSTLFLPELKDKVASLEKMVITTGDKDLRTIHLMRAGEAWQVVEKDHYFADTKKIRNFLVRLTDATLIEPKTTRQEYYEKIGVQEPNAKGGIKVELLGQHAKSITPSILIGHFIQTGNGTYVRKTNEAKSWLVSGDLVPETQGMDWVDKEILNVSADAIQKITIQAPKQPVIVLTKNKSEDLHFQLNGIDKNVSVAQDKIDALGNALRYLHFIEVRKTQETDFTNPNVTQLEYQLFDGSTIKAKLVAINDKNLLLLNVNANHPLQTKIEGWVYTLPVYKASNMVNTLDQLIVKKTKSKTKLVK